MTGVLFQEKRIAPLEDQNMKSKKRLNSKRQDCQDFPLFPFINRVQRERQQRVEIIISI